MEKEEKASSIRKGWKDSEYAERFDGASTLGLWCGLPLTLDEHPNVKFVLGPDEYLVLV